MCTIVRVTLKSCQELSCLLLIKNYNRSISVSLVSQAEREREICSPVVAGQGWLFGSIAGRSRFISWILDPRCALVRSQKRELHETRVSRIRDSSECGMCDMPVLFPCWTCLRLTTIRSRPCWNCAKARISMRSSRKNDDCRSGTPGRFCYRYYRGCSI